MSRGRAAEWAARKKLTDSERFTYRLAARLGVVDVEAMVEEMTFEQWARWKRFYDAEPWGPERDDIRFEVLRLRLLGQFSGHPAHSLPPFTWPHDRSKEIAEEADKLAKRAAELSQEPISDG